MSAANAVREAHALITAANVPLETRLKVGAALELLQDLLEGKLDRPPTAIDPEHVVDYQRKLITIRNVLRARAYADG